MVSTLLSLSLSQLESVNTPRSRDDEALRLMRHFDEFLAGEHAPLSAVFTDKARRGLN